VLGKGQLEKSTKRNCKKKEPAAKPARGKWEQAQNEGLFAKRPFRWPSHRGTKRPKNGTGQKNDIGQLSSPTTWIDQSLESCL